MVNVIEYSSYSTSYLDELDSQFHRDVVITPEPDIEDPPADPTMVILIIHES